MTILLAMIAAYLAGVLAALLLRKAPGRWTMALSLAAGAGLGVLTALDVLLSRRSLQFTIPAADPLFSLAFCLDPLGAFFLLLIGFVAIPAAIYGIGYSSHGHSRSARPLFGCMLNLFFLSMSLVVMSSGVLTFLIFWEAMSLTSYFLVIAEGDSENLSAGAWYAGMAHAGFLLVAAGLLLAAGGEPAMLFSDMRTAALPPNLKNAIFVLALLGFGSKAGLAPLHVWLPKAHPAAPSHISAMMSGAMVKLGIYGLIRVAVDLLGGGPPWWGGLLLGLGAASALLGVLYALMECDLKRLLAFSTVENVGLICMGVGLALVFHSYGLASAAGFALTAALFHALNHAAFKGLLFLAAGAVLHSAGTRNMEELGGLIRSMPVTAFCFLTGAAAISGLPPLNGFASEWMLFQSLLYGVKIPHSLIAAVMGLSVGVLALTAGLAAACFVKAFGISFLAIARSDKAKHAVEVCGSMRLAMLALAVACLLLGLLAPWAAPIVARSIAGLPGLDALAVEFPLGLAMASPDQLSRVSPAYIALLLAGVTAVLPLVLRLFKVNSKLRFGESWGCGRVVQTPRMEYTSTAFAEPLRRVFSGLYRPTKDISIDFHPESKYFVQSIRYRHEVRPWIEEHLYDPLGRAVRRLGNLGRLIQSGSVHWYVGYIFIALLGFLILARWL